MAGVSHSPIPGVSFPPPATSAIDTLTDPADVFKDKPTAELLINLSNPSLLKQVVAFAGVRESVVITPGGNIDNRLWGIVVGAVQNVPDEVRTQLATAARELVKSMPPQQTGPTLSGGVPVSDEFASLVTIIRGDPFNKANSKAAQDALLAAIKDRVAKGGGEDPNWDMGSATASSGTGDANPIVIILVCIALGMYIGYVITHGHPPPDDRPWDLRPPPPRPKNGPDATSDYQAALLEYTRLYGPTESFTAGLGERLHLAAPLPWTLLSGLRVDGGLQVGPRTVVGN